MAGEPSTSTASSIIGLRDVVVAKLLTDVKGTGATYDTPIPFAPAISASISANGAVTSIYTDDGPSESVSAIGEIEVEFESSQIIKTALALVLGHTINSDGVLEKSIQDVAPNVAIGFRSLKANGSYHYVWLLKGKFAVPDEKYQTKDNNVSAQTATIKGSFLRRQADDLYEVAVDSDDTNLGASVIENWLTAVYAPAA
ncbi:MAG: major tail protein [Sporolactobacillus sp.]